MTKKANFSSNGKRKGDERDHNNQNTTDNYKILSINISRYLSGGFQASLLSNYSGSRLGETELPNLSGSENCFDCFFKFDMSDSSGVLGPEEPELSKLYGYDDCGTCYDRLSFIRRITEQVKELLGGI